ncbi:BrnT family toxin [Verminephrobacter eiseniae]|uniref:BrnT family toxin n=1 Tax=Verminephrobacter eiseniae (strain EF01-2) TaxID=391735 RepID=A1WLU8_VEREI|nr:BrnT family toxin [Verminephrobacter eiseniae]ABM58605.1 protein of unknown function DUF497 [Verminephrobacter eiseniae EF01-2]
MPASTANRHHKNGGAQQIVITIKAMHIEFHAARNEANIRDRKLSFERAAEFDFDTAVIGQDTRKDYPETRFVAVGFLDERLHVLCFTPVAGGIRVISFRKANRREIQSHDPTRTADR